MFRTYTYLNNYCIRLSYDVKNYADLGSWYPPRPITFALGDGDTPYNGIGGEGPPERVTLYLF